MQCLAPHPKFSLRENFDLSPQKGGERLRTRTICDCPAAKGGAARAGRKGENVG
jgi:hypothetical protein